MWKKCVKVRLQLLILHIVTLVCAAYTAAWAATLPSPINCRRTDKLHFACFFCSHQKHLVSSYFITHSLINWYWMTTELHFFRWIQCVCVYIRWGWASGSRWKCFERTKHNRSGWTQNRYIEDAGYAIFSFVEYFVCLAHHSHCG